MQKSIDPEERDKTGEKYRSDADAFEITLLGRGTIFQIKMHKVWANSKQRGV